MEVIIKGKRTQTEKINCLDNVNQWINETLSKGTPDIRRAIKALDKLGQYLINNEDFLLPELCELGFSK